ncbi:MAG: NAD-dependent epimerase/dehydratase family protein [Bacteroidia bacterium]|jgi:nucleoside-diphosphate-sugar epimerase|nr:NAD-dependent epimerase/dehydratase family protein [Bacteroidia bacterium]
MQTILGSGGAIGSELAKALTAYTSDIRLVSRNPKKVNSSDLLFPADLTDPAQVSKAIEGSKVCYLTVGFDYNTKLWQQRWPELIKHVTAACIDHKTKLVFFDNVYAIGGNHVKHITEQSPISPSSKKGEVRAFVDKHILEQVEKGRLDAIIARAPDFFGPVKDKSILMNLIYDNFAKGKAAQWFCNADVIHTTGYTPDLAKGTALLGNSSEAYNQVWNLPVDQSPITGRQWAALFAAEMNAKNKMQVLPAWGLKLLGMFVPILGEMYEMRYQYDRDYVFDSKKFTNKFGYQPTTNAEAVKQTISALAGSKAG